MNWFIAPVFASTGREGTGILFFLERCGILKAMP
jgi:hypothetical protein